MGGHVELQSIELEIGRDEEPDCFRVQILDSRGGGTRRPLELDVAGILDRLNDLENAVLASASRVRRAADPDEKALREIGQQLFEAIFSGPIGSDYRASREAAGGRLQVALNITAPELAALPWETMWDPATSKYVCLDEPLIRHVRAPFAPKPLEIQPPVRVLGLVAAPVGLPMLNVRAEKENLGEALASAEADGLVELTWAPDASWRTIHELLLGEPWNVLHFIGHGDFDARSGEGRLALVGPDDRPDYVQASRLADLLSEADPTPRLVVLNSCAAGQSGAEDLLSGTAAALVHGGVSAVAAMQFSISDDAAIAFARGFYTAIAHGRPVDTAARSGRIEILGLHTLEWVTPVLYAREGVQELFSLKAPPVSRPRATQAETPGQAGTGDQAPRGQRTPPEEERSTFSWSHATPPPPAASRRSRAWSAHGKPFETERQPAEDPSTQVKRTRIHAPAIDVSGVAEALCRWYEGQGLEVIKATAPDGLLVQCRTHGPWKRRLGMGVALTVTLRDEGDFLLVETGAAKWLGKGRSVVLGAGLATHGVGWATVAVGAWKQYQLPRQTIVFLRMAVTTNTRNTS
jgi:hypothetical protein